MNITSYNYSNHNYNYQPRKLSNNLGFKSLPYTADSYIDCHNINRSTQHTTGLRKDLDYTELAKIINKDIKTKLSSVNEKHGFFSRLTNKLFNSSLKTQEIKDPEDMPKVTIYSMAGSDGTEAYAIANAIIGKMGIEKAKKYVFPIKVSDVSESIIEKYGKSGIVLFQDEEIKQLKHIQPYLKHTGKIYCGDMKEYELSPELKECFTFETMDLQKRIENFPKPKKNEFCISVVRNCLFQSFGGLATSILLNKMADNLPSESIVVFGDYDLKHMPDVFKGCPWICQNSAGNNNIFRIFSPTLLHQKADEFLKSFE